MERKARFDFEMEKVGPITKDGKFQMKIRPDPRRYSTVEKEGKSYYLDKYLKHLVPKEEMLNQMAGLPIFNLTPSIRSTRPICTHG